MANPPKNATDAAFTPIFGSYRGKLVSDLEVCLLNQNNTSLKRMEETRIKNLRESIIQLKAVATEVHEHHDRFNSSSSAAENKINPYKEHLKTIDRIWDTLEKLLIDCAKKAYAATDLGGFPNVEGSDWLKTTLPSPEGKNFLFRLADERSMPTVLSPWCQLWKESVDAFVKQVQKKEGNCAEGTVGAENILQLKITRAYECYTYRKR